MPPRRFFALLAALYAAFAAGAWILGVLRPSLADGGAVLISGLSSVGFGIGAWMEPSVGGLACARCGRASLGGLGFCTACGSGASR